MDAVSFSLPAERPHPTEILWLSAWKELVKSSFLLTARRLQTKQLLLSFFFFLEKHKLSFGEEQEFPSSNI